MYVTILAIKIITVCIAFAFGIATYTLCVNICIPRDLRKAGAIALVRRGIRRLFK
ncbi:hypothetical protein [Paenibacillus larvae]|uniref:hypothetical protein n=1 Tax=Paenibacillus larvae TaxID=1464 RepID=UPI0013146FC6|nr:hypothetical protein [Paenibacillus larvae]